MGRVYIEDVTTIALIYNYEATGSHSMMLSHDMIHNYAQVIDDNLDEMGSDFNGVHPLDFSSCIYFNTQDENGDWYSVLKPDVDIEKAKEEYIYGRSFDLELASKKENALLLLGIKMDGLLMKKVERNKVKQLVLGK